MISTVTKYTDKGKAQERENTFDGCVLATGEMNFLEDSDFYAVVWDENKKCVKRVEYGTTRAYTYDNYASVDATPEVIEKATAYLRKLWGTKLTRYAIELACKPDIGKHVGVHSTRGKFAGDFEGEVVWKQEQRSQYGTWSRGWRFGVRCDDGQVRFYNEDKIKVLDPTEYYQPPTDYQIDAYATNPRMATASEGLAFV